MNAYLFPLRRMKDILFCCCPCGSLSVCLSISLPAVYVHYSSQILKWDLVNRFIIIIGISRSNSILSTINQYLTELCSRNLKQFKFVSQFPFIFFAGVKHTDMRFCKEISHNDIGHLRFFIHVPSINFFRVTSMPFWRREILIFFSFSSFSSQKLHILLNFVYSFI